MSVKSSATSGFFTLPRELRDVIYELTLGPERKVPQAREADSTAQAPNGPVVTVLRKPSLSWLLSCKQIRAEYLDTIKDCSILRVSTDGTYELSDLAHAMRDSGLSHELLRSLRCWTIAFDWGSWRRFVAKRVGKVSLARDRLGVGHRLPRRPRVNGAEKGKRWSALRLQNLQRGDTAETKNSGGGGEVVVGLIPD